MPISVYKLEYRSCNLFLVSFQTHSKTIQALHCFFIRRSNAFSSKVEVMSFSTKLLIKLSISLFREDSTYCNLVTILKILCSQRISYLSIVIRLYHIRFYSDLPASNHHWPMILLYLVRISTPFDSR